MKIAIISDIHGNFEALKQVLFAIDKLKIKKIFCLGDIVGYYTQINECCEELQKRNVLCVMGNHDWYLSSGGFCPRSESVNNCLNFQRKIIKKKNIDWLKSFPLERSMYNIKMVHGGWADPLDEYFEPTEKYFSKVIGRVFVSGHTHKQQLKYFKEKIYCNPGSVGQPRDNDPRSAFAVYEDYKFKLYRINYNYNKVFELMNKAGFSDYYYGCLKYGSPNLRKL